MQRGHGLYNGTFANKAVLVSSDEEKETRLFKNVNLLRFFDHPNIVRLEGYSALWKPVLLLMENMSVDSCFYKRRAVADVPER